MQDFWKSFISRMFTNCFKKLNLCLSVKNPLGLSGITRHTTMSSKLQIRNISQKTDIVISLLYIESWNHCCLSISLWLNRLGHYFSAELLILFSDSVNYFILLAKVPKIRHFVFKGELLWHLTSHLKYHVW